MLLRLRDYDERLLAAMVLRRRPLLDRSFALLTHLGGATSTVTLALLAVFGVLPGVGVEAALTLGVTHVTVQLLKRAITRTRPELPLGFGFLAEPPDRFSFPSGHAAAALAVALPFATALPASLTTSSTRTPCQPWCSFSSCAASPFDSVSSSDISRVPSPCAIR